MALLITALDFKDTTGIDLSAELDEETNGTNFVTNWITSRQSEIFDYIASYAYHGVRQMQQIISDASNLEVLQMAIIHQCKYWLDNEEQANIGGILQHTSSVTKLSMAERLSANIAPRAHQVLSSSGLLYRGMR